jgi:ABC-2 type transport system ATP-binding protein
MDLIATNALTRTYGSRRGIENVDLRVAEGQIFGFLGPNGSGKTTAIRVMLGFLAPTSGDARIFGLDCWRDARRIKREVGYAPGDLRLYSWMNGETGLRIISGIRGQDLTVRGSDLADLFDLDMKVKVRKMSRGMRQKLGLILALAHRPRLLILDEPSSALDPLMQAVLHRHLRDLARDGHTVFFSSHTLSEVEQLCDRVAIVSQGRIIVDETLDALRARTGHQVTIRWEASAAEPDVPPFLEIVEREPTRWTCMLDGDFAPLLAWLAGRPVADLVIGRPDLEVLFRRYYMPAERRRAVDGGTSPAAERAT